MILHLNNNVFENVVNLGPVTWVAILTKHIIIFIFLSYWCNKCKRITLNIEIAFEIVFPLLKNERSMQVFKLKIYGYHCWRYKRNNCLEFFSIQIFFRKRNLEQNPSFEKVHSTFLQRSAHFYIFEFFSFCCHQIRQGAALPPPKIELGSFI